MHPRTSSRRLMAKTTDIQRQPHPGRLIHISKISPLSFLFLQKLTAHHVPRGTRMAHQMTQSRLNPRTITSYLLPMIFSPLLNMLEAVWFQGTQHRYNPNPTSRTIRNPRALLCSRSVVLQTGEWALCCTFLRIWFAVNFALCFGTCVSVLPCIFFFVGLPDVV